MKIWKRSVLTDSAFLMKWNSKYLEWRGFAHFCICFKFFMIIFRIFFGSWFNTWYNGKGPDWFWYFSYSFLYEQKKFNAQLCNIKFKYQTDSIKVTFIDFFKVLFYVHFITFMEKSERIYCCLVRKKHCFVYCMVVLYV